MKYILVVIALALACVGNLNAVGFGHSFVRALGEQAHFDPGLSDSFPYFLDDPDPHPEVFVASSGSALSVNTYKFSNTPEKMVLSGTQFLQNNSNSYYEIVFPGLTGFRFEMINELVTLGGSASITSHIHDDPFDGPGEHFSTSTGILNSPWPHYFEFFVSHQGEGASLSKFTLTLTRPVTQVPDGGSTLLMLSFGLGILTVAGRRIQ